MADRNGGRNVSQRDADASAIIQLRGELQSVRNEIGALRSQLSRLTGSETGPVQAMPQITTPGPEPYLEDPRHDPVFVDAIMRGDDAAAKVALRAARDRISDQISARGGRPAAVSEFELADLRRRGDGHEQRQALARSGLDLTDLDARGGVVQRDSATQVTVSYPQTATCPSGHPADPGHHYCPTCGGVLAAPALGEDWPSAEDRAARDREALQRAGVIGAEE
jgi:hypothetical protein